MDFNRFLDFLCTYSLPEEKKAFFSYFEKKEKNAFFTNFKGQIIFLSFLFIIFPFLNIKLFINFLFVGFFLILVKKIINFKENLKIFENLLKARISYEESSWFDLAIWEKPFFHLKYDHLLAKKQKRKIKQSFNKFFFYF